MQILIAQHAFWLERIVPVNKWHNQVDVGFARPYTVGKQTKLRSKMKKIEVTYKESYNSEEVIKETHWIPSNVNNHIAHAYQWFGKPGFTIFDIETVFDPC